MTDAGSAEHMQPSERVLSKVPQVTLDTAGLGYIGGAAVFSSLLALVAAGYFWTRVRAHPSAWRGGRRFP
jgi:hypothetical protein